MNKQENTYGYETTYSSYYPSSNSPSAANQPLPGQPPLPPMPPPPGALPPLPHVFAPMPQVTQIQSWAPAPTWQWIAPQATALAAQTSRDMNSTRGNYTRRDRFTHNRNNVYPPRGNFHRKNRRPRFDQPQTPFDPTTAAYFGQSLAASGISIDWQRGFAAAHNDAQNLVNHMAISMSTQSSGVNDRQESDQDIKIVSVCFQHNNILNIYIYIYSYILLIFIYFRKYQLKKVNKENQCHKIILVDLGIVKMLKVH